jgi:chromatin assembly factor 1 subunit A
MPQKVSSNPATKKSSLVAQVSVAASDNSTDSLNGPRPFVQVQVLQKRPSAPPKTTFPDIHMTTLVCKIDTLHAASLTFLVEAVYQDLKSQKVKKNSIEVKVKEIAEKCREKKYWVLKPEFRVRPSYFRLLS